MMLNDFSFKEKIHLHQDNNSLRQANSSSSQPNIEAETSNHQESNSSYTKSNNSTLSSSSSISNNSFEHLNSNSPARQHQQQFKYNSLSNHLDKHNLESDLSQHHPQHHRHHNHQQQQQHSSYSDLNEITDYTIYSNNPGNSSLKETQATSGETHTHSAATLSQVALKTETPSSLHPSRLALDNNEAKRTHNSFNMNIDSTQHDGSNMIPSAHNSDIHLQYSLPSSKSLQNSSSPSMALNFTHDLLQHPSQHNQAIVHHEPEGSNASKQQLPSSFSAGSLMQSGMNMWKNPIGLNPFRHPAISEHNFPDSNSFPTWTHANNLSQHQSNVSHHILDNSRLINYPHQHPRSSLPVAGQDLVGASLRSQHCTDQATFMLNSINHHASAPQNSSSNHQTQTSDDLSLRTQILDPITYNLAHNDNQFYGSSRAEARSDPANIKPANLMSDRAAIHMSLGNHNGPHHYSNHVDHSNLQATTSHQVAGSSSSSATSSKNIGIFRCPTCHEGFNLRTQFQTHLKTHSQDKVKTKFSCDLCGHSFSQKTSLNRHMKSHTGERPFPCEICGKAFSEKERLKIHMRTHTGEKPFSCTVCGKSFSQKSTVKRHQTVHTGEKKFKCDCGKGFANRGNLIAHIKTRGSNHFE